MTVPSWTTKRRWKKYLKQTPYAKEVFERDNYSCVDCGTDSRQLIIHHIDHSRDKDGNMNDDLDNLALVCKRCHAKRHDLVESNEVVKKLEQLSPDKQLIRGTMSMLARDFDISRERVRQIAKQAGFTMPNDKDNKRYCRECKLCGGEFYSQRERLYCSPECYKKARKKKYYTTTECKNCGDDIEYLKSRETYGLEPTYCSKECQGEFLAKNYGWGATKVPKYKSINNLKDTMDTPFTVRDFVQKFGYSYTSGYTSLEDLVTRGIVRKLGKKDARGRPNLYEFA